MKRSQILSIVGLLLIFLGGVYYIVYKIPADKLSKKLEHSRKQAENWETEHEHAQMLTYLKRYDEAEQEYRALLALKPDSAIAKTELAKILYYQNRYNEALNLLKQIPAIQENAKATLLLADIQLSLKNYTQAESLYQAYLKKFPEDQKAQLKLAAVLSWQKKYEPSIEIYQRILSKDPNNVQARRHYALVLIWMGKQAEGAKELEKTLETEKSIP